MFRKCYLNMEEDKNHFAFTRDIRANIVIEFYYFFYVKFLKCCKLKSLFLKIDHIGLMFTSWCQEVFGLVCF